MQRGRILFQISFCLIFLLQLGEKSPAQESRTFQPRWWFGGSIGGNVNFYSTDIKTMNSTVSIAPNSFSNGSGLGLYLSPLLEYRPDPIWGGIIHLGFDSRRGSFDDVSSAGLTHTLSTSMNYISLEPSLRISPFTSNVYFFAGPRLGFNVAKSFTYQQQGSPSVESEWSGIRGSVISGQIGVGYDISLSARDDETQYEFSPFVSFHFGQGPRSEEQWSLTSIRTGVALKVGSTSASREQIEREVQFSIREPKIIPIERRVKETFPLRNHIFFDEVSSDIPNRYTQLSKDQATSFHEEQFLQPQPKDLTSRSYRQLTVYHNILNILGDRMRKYQRATVTLSGASGRGSSEGGRMAESIKRYLVDVFGIEGSRIGTEGREKPSIPSVQPGGTRELELVRPEDQRVDVSSSTIELLEPVQIVSLQEDPLDSDVLFNVAGADELLSSWSLEVTDEQGTIKRFGPYTKEQERIRGKLILGDRLQGRYQVIMNGQTKGGLPVRKDETIRLVRSDEPEEQLGLRFSILFEFDQSKTVATYERFLSDIVSPLIPVGGSVIIHGHTDIVGEESHNLKLSRDRSYETMNIIERALAKSGKRRVRFDTYGFGEDVHRAPFENNLPEERFYNRTVIIDIIPD